jgi:simple sugar transport system ATP-binding protein
LKVLEIKQCTKRFPGVLANDRIDLDLHEGEIHALLGENGAGKSTLMNILYGLYQPEEGEIWVRDKRVQIFSPSDAIAAGIGMVHQHFMLVPVFSVTDNVMLGEEEATIGGFLNRNEAADKIRELSERFGLDVDPDSMVGDLPVGVQQRVEIIKLLYRDADILIFDEPTAVLTPQEADSLFEIMRLLVDQGKSIIFITHKLREVLEYSDRITVIRRGKVVGSAAPDEASPEMLAELMVGRAVDFQLDRASAAGQGEAVLEVSEAVILDDLDQVAVDGVTFTVKSGEILGVAGVQGNGQTELVEAITGLSQVYSGRITILGTEVTNKPPRFITDLGTAHIPEDRQRDGLVLSFPITDNLALQSFHKAPFSDGPTMKEDFVRENAARLIQQFDIRTPHIETAVGALSGGNQQKVIVAREFSRDIRLLVAAQPTRGLDVGSIEYIHGQIIENRNSGVGVLLVSTELDEVMQLSDRIAVMYDGQITALVDASDVTKEQVGLLMAGTPLDEVLG